MSSINSEHLSSNHLVEEIKSNKNFDMPEANSKRVKNWS